MDYRYLLSIHIVFVVSWFAALFYIVRLFIYTTEAQSKDEPAKEILTTQLLMMQRKLWNIIGWPAMIGTVIFGSWMLYVRPDLFGEAWMWLKLSAVVGLVTYHLFCNRILRQQRRGIFKLSSFKLRLFNELATVFLVAIVFLVKVKSSSGLIWGLLGLTLFAVSLMLAVKIYRNAASKTKSGEEKNLS